MNIEIKEIKGELDHLCHDYINIISKMRDENIIDNETYNKCTLKKLAFLDSNNDLHIK